MGDRKDDVIIYLISGFFFACTIGGGVFLCMFIVLPQAESTSWYPVAGMTLVAIPWVSWFLIYLYRCFRPTNVQFDEYHNHGNGNGNGNGKGTPKSIQVDVVTSPFGAKSNDHSPVSGERHVHFGAVIEMGNGFGGGGGGKKHHNEDVAENLQHKEQNAIPSSVMVQEYSRENEAPLNLI